MNGSLLDIFKIDRLGKGIFAKLLFAVALLAGVSVYFTPLGDTDFTAFIVWAQNMMGNVDLMMNMSPADIPLSSGNIIYLLHLLAADMFVILCGFIYCGVYIRQYRLEHGVDEPGDSGYLIPPRFLVPISAGKLALRIFVVICFSIVMLLPLSFTVLYLFLIFIIILPVLSMYPACYLSGDSGLIGSFPEMVKVTKGYYLVNARNMSLIVCMYFVGSWITSWLMSFMPSAAYVIEPVINVFLALSFGRYVGMVYCRMREVPGGLRIGAKLHREAGDK